MQQMDTEVSAMSSPVAHSPPRSIIVVGIRWILGAMFWSLALWGVGLAEAGWLGSGFQEWLLDPPGRQSVGIMTDVIPRSPAATAGIQRGDIIIAIQRQSAKRDQAVVDVVQALPPGSRLTLELLRSSQRLALTVTLGASPIGPAQIQQQVAQNGPVLAPGHWRKYTSPQGHSSVEQPDYLTDPSLCIVAGCLQPWHSLAFPGGLRAPPEEFAVPVSAQGIFSTFTPNLHWGAEPGEILSQATETQMAKIKRRLNRISRMEMDQRMQEIESTRRIGQGWIDALGGVSRYKDPKDWSYEGTIPWSKMPSRPTRWWRCGFQRPPMPSNTWPGAGCSEIPSPR